MSQTRRTFVAGAAAFSFAAGRAPAFAQQKVTPIRIVVASVGLLNSINHVHFIEWMRRNGGDAKAVQLTEIPFPQMADALMQDRLDAVWAVEPFFTILKKSGNVRVIGYPYQENIPNMDVTAMFAKESWLKGNADGAKRFRAVFARAQKFISEAPKEDRDAFVSNFTSVRPELVAEMSLPIFVSDFNLQSLKTNMELAVGQKLMKSIDVDSMIWKG